MKNTPSVELSWCLPELSALFCSADLWNISEIYKYENSAVPGGIAEYEKPNYKDYEEDKQEFECHQSIEI